MNYSAPLLLTGGVPRFILISCKLWFLTLFDPLGTVSVAGPAGAAT
jgi:hypothetical protein